MSPTLALASIGEEFFDCISVSRLCYLWHDSSVVCGAGRPGSFSFSPVLQTLQISFFFDVPQLDPINSLKNHFQPQYF